MMQGAQPGPSSGAAHYVVRTEVNQRENNEDSFQVFHLVPAGGAEPLAVLALADGMGGHEHGEDASREALHKLSLSLVEQLCLEPSLNQLEPHAPSDVAHLQQVLLAGFEQADAHVRRMVLVNQWRPAGSTVVAAIVGSNVAVVGNLGDSPLFHFRPETGQLRQVTRDHTATARLVRAGLITEAMARVHEARGQLDYFVGAGVLPDEAPLHVVHLEEGDLLLLCSDGVNGSLSVATMATILAESGADLDTAADRLLAAARATGETDNQTLILWRQPAVIAG